MLLLRQNLQTELVKLFLILKALLEAHEKTEDRIAEYHTIADLTSCYAHAEDSESTSLRLSCKQD